MYVSSITVDQVIDALKAVLTPIVTGGQIVRGQGNRVPLPSNPCAVLTEKLQIDLQIPSSEYQSETETATVSGPTRIDIQIDFYGAAAGEYCKVTQSLFRSSLGYSLFPDNIKPLFTSDGIQAPLTTGEQQYESRWTITASLQYNPIVTVPQQFADEAYLNKLVPVDVFSIY